MEQEMKTLKKALLKTLELFFALSGAVATGNEKWGLAVTLLIITAVVICYDEYISDKKES